MRRDATKSAPRPLRSAYVTGTHFQTLGIRPFAGRLLTPDDDTPASPPALVMSYRTWQGVYGGDAAMVGGTVLVEGHAFTVAGISPPGFFGETSKPDPPDIWIPLQQEPVIAGAETSLLRQPISAWLRVIGRLRPGATTDGMEARLTAMLRQWMRTDAGYPANWMPEVERTLPQQSLTVVPAGAGVGLLKESYGRSLRILLAVCGLVLLIACANVANLLLARAVARRGQTAIRIAMGAPRRRVVAEALLESVVLALGGALVGLVVAIGAGAAAAVAGLRRRLVPAHRRHAVAARPRLRHRRRPADRAAVRRRPGLAGDAHRSDRGARGAGRTAGDRASAARTTLLVLQAALSVVLVAGSTMLGQSLGNLAGQDLGYPLDDRVLVSVGRPDARCRTRACSRSTATSSSGWPAFPASAASGWRSTTR